MPCQDYDFVAVEEDRAGRRCFRGCGMVLVLDFCLFFFPHVESALVVFFGPYYVFDAYFGFDVIPFVISLV